MHQYYREGFIYALEKRGLNKVASEIIHSKRAECKDSEKDKDKEKYWKKDKKGEMDKEASSFIQALFKLAFKKTLGMGLKEMVSGSIKAIQKGVKKVKGAKPPVRSAPEYKRAVLPVGAAKVAPKTVPKSKTPMMDRLRQLGKIK